MFKEIRKWFLLFEEILERHFSYGAVVTFEDSMVFLFGIFLGAIIMTFIISRVFTKSRRIEGEKFGKISLIRFTDKDEKTFFINDGGKVFEAMRMLLIIAFAPWFTVKSYTRKDEKRTKIFIWIILILGCIITIFALLSITTVNIPTIPIPPTP